MLETTFHKLLQEGREEGREKGREEAAVAFAKKLLARGFPPDEVADLSGLSLERIRTIAEEDPDRP